MRNFIYLTQQFAAWTRCIISAALHFRNTHAVAVAYALATVAAVAVAAVAAVAAAAIAIVRLIPVIVGAQFWQLSSLAIR